MGRALCGAAGGSGAVFLLFRWAPAARRAVPLPAGGGSRCAAGTCASAVCRVLPAAAPPRPAGTGRDEPREGGREAARSPRPARAPAAPGRGAGVVPALLPPEVREPRAAAAGREAPAPASPVTLHAPPVALPFVNIFVFFFHFFPFPLRPRRAPASVGLGVAGGARLGAVPRDVPRSTPGAQLLRILCVVASRRAFP